MLHSFSSSFFIYKNAKISFLYCASIIFAVFSNASNCNTKENLALQLENRNNITEELAIRFCMVSTLWGWPICSYFHNEAGFSLVFGFDVLEENWNNNETINHEFCTFVTQMLCRPLRNSTARGKQLFFSIVLGYDNMKQCSFMNMRLGFLCTIFFVPCRTRHYLKCGAIRICLCS